MSEVALFGNKWKKIDLTHNRSKPRGRRRKQGIVCGVGINDGLYKNVAKDDAYHRWQSMLVRCYGKKYQHADSTYLGVTVAPEWLYFSVFREWMMKQDYQGKELDKDILVPGNKVYSADTCVFVCAATNMKMRTIKPRQNISATNLNLWKASTIASLQECLTMETDERVLQAVRNRIKHVQEMQLEEAQQLANFSKNRARLAREILKDLTINQMKYILEQGGVAHMLRDQL